MPSNPPRTLLLDTNILLRFVSQNDPLHQTTVDPLAKIASQSSSIFICPQNLVEFRQVATRASEANGLGLDSAKTAQLMTILEGEFMMIAETPAIYPAWRKLVETVQASGRANFDTRIAAVGQINNIEAILTYEEASFAKYGTATGITILNPKSI